jgi:hypothetical protein
MFRPTGSSIALTALALTAAPAAGQFVPPTSVPKSAGFGSHVGVELGVGLRGLSYTRSVIVPTATDYVLTFRGIADPTGGFRADLGATLRPGQRLSYSAYATATTLDRNRFYGVGNLTEATRGADFYRLDQFRIELGLAARLGLGSRNEIVAGPFFRRMNTDARLGLDDRREASDEDDDGLMALLQPYGAGTLRQLGFRTDLRLSTEGPDSGRRTGIRFYGGGTAYAAALDMREPVLSMYGDTKAFVRIAAPLEPILYVRGAVQKVIGDYPFQDAAYLGGRGSLRGFEKQRFAGDLSVLGSTELYGTAARLRVRGRPVTTGFMLLADVGRMYADSTPAGSAHFAAGGGLWFRDELTNTEVTISVADGGAGPRLYLSLGSAFWQ